MQFSATDLIALPGIMTVYQ